MLDEVTTQEPRHERTFFEHSDLNSRATLITGIAVLVGMWIALGLMYFYFAHLLHERNSTSAPPLPAQAHLQVLPPQPRLQPSPRLDLQQMRAREDWQLNHYFWIDKSKGTVAIPIEQAMELTAQRGIPPRQETPEMKLSQPEAGTRQTGFEGKVAPEPR